MNPKNSNAAETRARAEAALRAKALQDPEKQTVLKAGSEPATLHELQVHQLELEMQNEELVRAQVQLEESRARYMDLFEHAPVGYCVLGPTGLILQGNLTFAALLGESRDALVGQLFLGFIVKEDRDAFYLLEQEILAAQATAERPAALSQGLEVRLKKAGGTTCWVSIVAAAVVDESSKPALRLTVSDIGARRALEAVVRENAHTQADILDALPAHIALVDQEGVILSTNASWRRFARANVLKGSEFCLGQNYLEVCDRAIGPCSREAKAAAAGIRRVLIGETSEFSLEYPCHSPTEHRWFRLMATPLREGERAGAVVMHVDVTERKLAESKLLLADLVLKNVSQGVIIAGPDQKILSANAAFTAITGYSEPEILGRNCRLMQGTGTDPVMVAAIRRSLEDASDFSGEILNYRKDGSPFWNELTITPVLDSDGVLTHFIGVTRDITARKEIEAALRASEAIARAIIEASPVPMALNDEGQQITFLNPAFTAAFGYSLADIPTLADWWPKAYPDPAYRQQVAVRWQAELGRSAQTGTAFAPLELSIRCKDGRERFVMVSAAPLGKSFAGTHLVVLHDITERKLAEARLLASLKDNADLRAALDQHAIVAMTDARGRITFVNDKFCRISQYSSGELLGQDHRMINSGQHPKEFFRNIWATIQSGRVWQGDICNRAKDGTLYWVDTTIVPFLDEKGAIDRFLAIRKDITERWKAEVALRESQERFRQLAENIQEVFWISDVAKNHVDYISPAYEKIWGRTCEQLYQHPRSWMEAIHPEDLPRIVHAVETKQVLGLYDETYRILRADGEVRWIHDKAFPVMGPNGEVQCIVGTAEDITERVELEGTARQSQKLQTIGTLAAGIAHDFNNILAALLGNTEMAMADTAPEHPARESLDEIKKALDRAKGLVQQILAFSSQYPTERHPLALGPVVLEVAKFLRATIPANVQIVTSVDPEAPLVLADPTQMHQILVNLCTNAWHALGDQPGCIEVRLWSETLTAETSSRIPGLTPGRYGCLSVRDNGKGMEAATLKRIFDPFFTTKGPGKGTGLGLSVVHGIVRGYEGAIQVVSHPGEGATFTLYFPASATGPGIAGPGIASSPSIPIASGRILYLDDDESILFAATRTLERLGYRITGFARPADAVKAFRDNPSQFDLAVTDMNMPEVNGLSFARELLKVRADLPIVLVSGNIEEGLRHAAREAGIKGIVCKPFTIEEISEAIRRLMSVPRQT